MTKTQKYAEVMRHTMQHECFKRFTGPLEVVGFENTMRGIIIRRAGAIGRNLGLKAAQGYAVNNGLTKAHARAAMQLQATLKGGL